MTNTTHDNEPAYLHHLAEAIAAYYGLSAQTITPINRGFYGETWRLRTAAGDYSLKLDYDPLHQMHLQKSLAVVDCLNEQGLTFVQQVVKTKNGSLFARINGAVLAVFDWIPGENVESDATKPAEYALLGQVYAATVPGFEIPTDKLTARNTLNGRLVLDGMRYFADEAPTANPTITALWQKMQAYASEIYHYAERADAFAAACAHDLSHLYFTHGDAGSNLLRDPAGRYHLLDWDEVQYAAPERDAWVMAPNAWPGKPSMVRFASMRLITRCGRSVWRTILTRCSFGISASCTGGHWRQTMPAVRR